MKLRITDKYMISTDDLYGWNVYARAINKKTGEEYFKVSSYHATFSDALARIGDEEIRASDAQTFADALDHMNKILVSIGKALDMEERIEQLRAEKQV